MAIPPNILAGLVGTLALGPVVAMGTMAGVVIKNWPRPLAYAIWAAWGAYAVAVCILAQRLILTPVLLYAVHLTLAVLMARYLVRERAARGASHA